MSESTRTSALSVDIDALVEYLNTASIRLAVFGEFSAGKTTVLNALIGEEILSVAVEPTTAVPTRVRYGREFNIFVERTGGDGPALFEDDPPFWTRFVGRRDTLSTLRTCLVDGSDVETQWSMCMNGTQTSPVAALPGECRSRSAQDPRSRRPETVRQTGSEEATRHDPRLPAHLDEGDSDSQQQDSRYVDAEEIVNNEEALKALDGFVDRLTSSAAPVSEGIIESAKDAILGPVDQSIHDQRRLIRQIKNDLRQTEQEQQGTRDELAAQEKQVEALQERYEELMGEIEAMVG